MLSPRTPRAPPPASGCRRTSRLGVGSLVVRDTDDRCGRFRLGEDRGDIQRQRGRRSTSAESSPCVLPGSNRPASPTPNQEVGVAVRISVGPGYARSESTQCAGEQDLIASRIEGGVFVLRTQATGYPLKECRRRVRVRCHPWAGSSAGLGDLVDAVRERVGLHGVCAVRPSDLDCQ